MAEYVLLTDAAGDLPEHRFEELGVRRLEFHMSDNENRAFWTNEIQASELYAGLRAGKMYHTASISIGEYFDVFQSIVAEGVDLVYFCFSSGLSSTINNARLAASEAEAANPGRRVVVFDTLCASGGQGYLVTLAAKAKESGMDLSALLEYLNGIKTNIDHQFTVDDLFFLKRGGRISAATAIIGTVLQFKPMLHMDDAGHLCTIGKVRGRKAAITALADKMAETLDRGKTNFVLISHGDCKEDAETLADLVRERFGYDVEICDIGPSVGAHSGPGTLAIFYVGTER